MYNGQHLGQHQPLPTELQYEVFKALAQHPRPHDVVSLFVSCDGPAGDMPTSRECPPRGVAVEARRCCRSVRLCSRRHRRTEPEA